MFVALRLKDQLPEIPPDRPQLITGRDYEDDEKTTRLQERIHGFNQRNAGE